MARNIKPGGRVSCMPSAAEICLELLISGLVRDDFQRSAHGALMRMLRFHDKSEHGTETFIVLCTSQILLSSIY